MPTVPSQTSTVGAPSIQSSVFNTTGMHPTDSDNPDPAPANGQMRQIPGANVGFGFRIIPMTGAPGAFPLKVFVDGIGNTGRNIIMVTDSSVFLTRFSNLQFSMPLINQSVGGQYVAQIITAQDGQILPCEGSNDVIGSVQANTYALNADGTSAQPSVITDGQQIGGAKSFEAFIQPVTGGAQISGGGLDIYRWDIKSFQWVLFMEGIPVPAAEAATTPSEPVGIPLDNFLLSNPFDRWYVGINPNSPITYSVGASASVTIFQRAQ